MPANRNLKVGLVGTGFMGRTHSNAYGQVLRFFPGEVGPELVAVCSRNEATARDFAAQWGFDSYETDWRRLIERSDIDLIDIASPNDTHAEIAVAAAGAGKMVACEKPLGRTVAEARRMAEAVERAAVPNMVWYNYRRVPALTLAKHLIDEGRLGRIFHSRFKFLQDWTMSADLPQGGAGTWRLDAGVSGSGVTGDLLAHCIDAALWLVGPVAEVSGTSEIFIRERMHISSGKRLAVTAEDASLFLARFTDGSLATFEATRFARGHKALFTLEVNGEHGSIAWDLHDLHRLQYFSHRDEGALRGWRSIHVSDGDHPYMKSWWVPGLQIGYEHTFVHQVADFLAGLRTGEKRVPDFRDGLATDAVVEAVLRSARSRQWEAVEEISASSPEGIG
ncbi:Gfo/Idh/MocA family oxidoreductase [Mesorhizobium sp. BAC0120]|uniref:Gfo/Idh/MocA family protein n=1 Tax=Mesorhizobium sp. BAC0120 TaxID=3090670 RepID=UPI00298C54DD|nr:Gfo/Idh/MocA family oxidoreductase [Mesorhizobium sp. BAC0120]MDW6026263.1 Gfo/Idh/MocA family oxidoreductase [Mesorhizobium sp. BAC0120]